MRDLEIKALTLFKELRTANENSPLFVVPTKTENIMALSGGTLTPATPENQDCFLVYYQKTNPPKKTIERLYKKDVYYYEIGRRNNSQENMSFYSVPANIEIVRKLFNGISINIADQIIDPKTPDDKDCILTHLKEDITCKVRTIEGKPVFYNPIFSPTEQTILKYNLN